MAFDPRQHVVPGQPLRIAAEQINWLNQQMRRPRAAPAAPVPLGPVSTVCVVVHQSLVNAAFSGATGQQLSVGHAVDLPLNAAQMFTAVPADKRGTEVHSYAITSEADAPPLSLERRAIRLTSFSFQMAESFGVIQDIARPTQENPDYTLTLIVGGVFSCLAYGWAYNQRLCGAYPFPGNNNGEFPPGLWRPYPVMAAAGAGAVLAIGAYHTLGQNGYPSLFEALVRL